MADIKTQLIQLLKVKNEKIEDFKTATLTCITNINDYKDDTEKAEKYVECINQRKDSLEHIQKISDAIKNTSELNKIFESSDEDIEKLKQEYNKHYESIKKLQPNIDMLGQSILGDMRKGFKKVKQQQQVNTIYLDSPYTSGTKFDIKQ